VLINENISFETRFIHFGPPNSKTPMDRDFTLIIKYKEEQKIFMQEVMNFILQKNYLKNNNEF
jgi:hypothetical protein